MNERSKLAEANHFLGQMQAKHVGLAAFTNEFSAFLGATRSVLQYANREAMGKRGGQKWHDDAMGNSLFRYFMDLREELYAAEPIDPERPIGKHPVAPFCEAQRYLVVADQCP